MSVNGMRPVHPGEVLREEYLEPLGMSVNALAGALNITATRLNDIVRERRRVTPDTALRLSQYFGTTPEFWLNLQMMYELRKASEDEGQMIRETIRPLEMEVA